MNLEVPVNADDEHVQHLSKLILCTACMNARGLHREPTQRQARPVRLPYID
jgi:hypothetical protein